MADWEDNKKKQGMNYVPPPPSAASSLALAPPPPAMAVPPQAMQSLPAMSLAQAMGGMAPAAVQTPPAIGAINGGLPLPGPGAAGFMITEPAVQTSNSLDPDMLEKYKGRLKDMTSDLDAARAEQSKVNDRLLADPQSAAQSPFEQKLGGAVQDRLLKLLSGEETVGDRFRRGYDVGQKFAADVLAPMIGSFSKRPGSAQGIMMATNDLQQQAERAQQQRAAERQAHNQSIMNLSNLYENISPNSAKNLKNLFDMKIQTQKFNMEAKKDADEKVNKASDNLQKGTKDFIDFIQKKDQHADDERDKAMTRQDAEMGLGLHRDALNETKAMDSHKFDQDKLENQNKAEKLKVDQDNRDINRTKAKGELDLRQEESQQKAMKAVADHVKNLRSAFTTQGANGSRYKDAYEYFKANPAEKELLNNEMKAAKMNTTVDDVVKQLDALKAGTQPTGKNFDLGEFFANWGGTLAGLGKGAPPADAAPSAVPTKSSVIGDAGPGYAPGYPAVANLPASKYLDEKGNIDLSKRQMINNPEKGAKPSDVPYQYGSEYSGRVKLDDGRHMVFPLIYNGQVHDFDEAAKYAKDNHQHMGIFKANTPLEKTQKDSQGRPADVMEQYEDALHSRPIYVNGEKLNGDVWKAKYHDTTEAPSAMPTKGAPPGTQSQWEAEMKRRGLLK